jgi:expansin (peptidoglycan-binding protein)
MGRALAVLGATVLLTLGGCSDGPQPNTGAAGADGSVPADDGGGVPGNPDGGVTADATSDAAIPVGDGGPLVTYGQPYQGGQYNLGPVDWQESQFHNACAPLTKYPASISQAEGTLLAGLWNGIPNVAGYCDACIYVTTAKGKSAMLRVVTYGNTSTNSIDTSPDAYQILNSNEYPRPMTWQLAKCPDTGKIVYEFQTGSSQWWTSLWVRNARVPLTKVEVQSPNHGSYFALARGSDGTLTDSGGFGSGSFSIRLTGIDNQEVVDTFAWPSAGIAGQMLTGQGNFQ